MKEGNVSRNHTQMENNNVSRSEQSRQLNTIIDHHRRKSSSTQHMALQTQSRNKAINLYL